MKKALLTLSFFVLAIAVQAQTTALKVHSDGTLSLQSALNTGGVQFLTSGFASFEPAISNSYGRMEQTKVGAVTSKCWIVRNNLNIMPSGDMFYVTGGGSVYYYHLYNISNPLPTKGVEPIGNASELISRMKGYYSDSDEFAGNPEDLVDNENVAPEAIEGLLSDMEKSRSVVMNPEELETVLPEAVRHTAEGNVGINYNALVTVLIEAFKEQQERIEVLEAIIEENGLMRK